jgi:hypothetical protein
MKAIVIAMIILSLANGNKTELCRVSCVTENEVFVITPDGNEYSFLTDGCTDYTVGSYWEVTFNPEMEIIDVQ